jgi:hypothetical protein
MKNILKKQFKPRTDRGFYLLIDKFDYVIMAVHRVQHELPKSTPTNACSAGQRKECAARDFGIKREISRELGRRQISPPFPDSMGCRDLRQEDDRERAETTVSH